MGKVGRCLVFIDLLLYSMIDSQIQRCVCRLECLDLTAIYCFCLQEELGQIGVALLPEMVVKRTRI